MIRNILTINLSPRKHGTSVVCLEKCTKYLKERGHSVRHIDLYSHLENFQLLFNSVNDADTLIFSGPCYVNTYPADTVKLLEEMAMHPEILHEQNIYAIIQGGMPYTHTHYSGLKMLEIFASKMNVNYQGGFVIGLGAMLNGQPLSKLLNGKKVIRQMNIFCEHIHKGTKSPNSVYETAALKAPCIITWMLAKIMNREIDKTFAKRGMDAHSPSPYALDEQK